MEIGFVPKRAAIRFGKVECHYAVRYVGPRNGAVEPAKFVRHHPSDITRERILKAARSLFADRGYQDTSIRAVVAKARVNQAAINYHFGGKDGLYREVLRAAIRALTEHQLAHAEEMKGMSRENALVEFVKYQLRPLAARD